MSTSTGNPTKKKPTGGNAPTGLAKKSKKLATIVRPPDATIAKIDSAKAQAGSRYFIIFAPYGKGPGSDGPGSGLVIHISESKPAADVEEPFDFNGGNTLVDMSRLPSDQVIDQGGTYEGTLELVESGGLLVPYLLNVGSTSRGQ